MLLDWALVGGWFLLGAGLGAEEEDARVDLARRIAAYNQHTRDPWPELDDGQITDLLNGELVRFRAPAQEGVDRAVGLLVSKASRESLWLASSDACVPGVARLTEYLVEAHPNGGGEWIGFLELPAPVRDRQWLVDTVYNTELVQQTQGESWERHWREVPNAKERLLAEIQTGAYPSLTLAQVEDAITTPINRGGWVVLPLADGRSLLAYHTAVVIGGVIPDALVTQFAMMEFDELLHGIERRALEVMPTHYVPGHVAILGGDGVILPWLGESP